MNLKIAGRNFKQDLLTCLLGAGLLMAGTAGAQNFNLNVLTSFGYLTNNTGIYPRGTLVQGPDGTLYGTTLAGAGSGAQGSVFKINPDGSGIAVLHGFTGGADGGAPLQAALTLSGNTLYGTASDGGANNNGVVFAVNTDGTGFTVLYSFGSQANDGNLPAAGLTLVGNVLYGMTKYGGTNDDGTVFGINTDGTGYTNLYDFSGSPDGINPVSRLVLSGNTLYGTTLYEGTNGGGTVFAINTDGSGYTNLYAFNQQPDGTSPGAGLALAGNTLYGTTIDGGNLGNGSVFAINTDGSGYTNLYSFDASDGGAFPNAELVVSNNVLYGTASGGGPDDNGAVFRLNTDGTDYTNLYFFTNNPDGSDPATGLILSGNTLYGVTYQGGANYYGTIFAINTDGTGYTVLFNNFSSGYTAANPWAGLILSGSTLYGTTAGGGINGQGTVFAINTNGTGLTVLYNFGNGSTDGTVPYAALVLSGNTLYGTTSSGGSNSAGTVFAVNTDGTGYTNLYDFTGGSDGGYPYAALTLSGSTLYGVALGGGDNYQGTIFALNTDGTGFINLYSFGGLADQNASGAYNGLIVSGNKLYGSTQNGGTNGNGTIFSLNTDGTDYSVIYSFNSIPDAGDPYLGKLALSGNRLYGTTYGNGATYHGAIFAINTDGTDETVLYSFTGGADGSNPYGQLTLSGNMLYGTTPSGGAGGSGAVFGINTNGTGFTVLHSFSGGSDGVQPFDAPLLIGNTLYGTAQYDGAFGAGTVFSLSATPAIVASNNIYTRNGLNTWRIKVSDLFTNATDLNSNTLSLANVGPSTNGVSLVISYGYVQYYNTNLVDDQFTYQATDTNGALSTGVITLTANNPTGGQINNITVTGSSVSLTFAGIPTYLYHVQVSTNLVNWTTLETTNAPGGGLFQFIDANPPEPSAFYRLMWSGN